MHVQKGPTELLTTRKIKKKSVYKSRFHGLRKLRKGKGGKSV